VVEALHLTDGVVEFVEISDEKFGKRRDKTEGMLSGINAAHFPTEINPVTCPRCPHFFICPAAPKGRSTFLKKCSFFPGTPCFFRSPLDWTENGKGAALLIPARMLHMTSIDVFYQGEGIGIAGAG
jgi:hypothetical protein